MPSPYYEGNVSAVRLTQTVKKPLLLRKDNRAAGELEG